MKQGSEVSMGYHVRGGTTSENLILLDGVPVYNAWHFFGFFGAFNPYVLGDVHLMKGSYPAEYGGRLASVLALDVKTPEPGRARGHVTLSSVSLQAAAEGSARDGRVRWIVGARRSHMDPLFWIARLQASARLDGSKGEHFHMGYALADVNAKVTASLSKVDRLSASLFAGKDRLGFRLRDLVEVNRQGRHEEVGVGFGWTNLTGRLAWRHHFAANLTSEAALYGTRHRFGTDAHSQSWPSPERADRFRYDYGVRFDDVGAKASVAWMRPAHTVFIGVEAVRHGFEDDVVLSYNYESDEETLEELENQVRLLLKSRPSYEAAVFVQDDWDVTGQLRLRPGLRATRFAAHGVAARRYAALEPRLTARYLIGPRVRLKAGAVATRQFLHQVSDDWAVLASDRWFPADADHPPGRAWQVSGGVEALLAHGFDLDVEAYYRRQGGLLRYSPYAERAIVRNVIAGLFGPAQEDFVTGEGEAYGVEAFLRKAAGRISGFASYTLAWVWNRFDDLNSGRAFPALQDRRHDFTVTAVYRASERIEWAATWTYKTGAPFNVPIGYYRFDQPVGRHSEGFGSVPTWLQFPGRNRYRMPAYHRLDLSFAWQTKRLRSLDKDGARFSLNVYNVYNRSNAFMLLVDDGSISMPGLPRSDDPRLLRLGLLPILPSLSIQLDL